jgi:hypothetical protein
VKIIGSCCQLPVALIYRFWGAEIGAALQTRSEETLSQSDRFFGFESYQYEMMKPSKCPVPKYKWLIISTLFLTMIIIVLSIICIVILPMKMSQRTEIGCQPIFPNTGLISFSVSKANNNSMFYKTNDKSKCRRMLTALCKGKKSYNHFCIPEYSINLEFRLFPIINVRLFSISDTNICEFTYLNPLKGGDSYYITDAKVLLNIDTALTKMITGMGGH